MVAIAGSKKHIALKRFSLLSILSLVFLWSQPGMAWTPVDCPLTSTIVCGKNVAVPFISFGSQVVLKVPSPYQHQRFTASCTNVGNLPQVQFPDLSSVTCVPLTCPASEIQLCGRALPVDGGTVVGQTIDAAVPASFLANPSSGPNPSFTVHCLDDGNDGAIYKAENPSNLSCSLFPCDAANVTLCGTSVPVEGGAVMGSVLQLTMPPPFKPDPFSVQCVGSGANAPQYQVSDSSAVTCTQGTSGK